MSFVTSVFAAEEKKIEADFATSYDVIYDITEDGVTTVTEKVSLKNLTSQSYATKFKLTIGATQIYDVKASDGSGVMEVETKKQDTSTTIDVKFNQQVAGLDKVLPWTLQFKSRDFAEKIGKVWEVRAPKISSSTSLESYNLTISVPQGFGEPTLISPTPKTQSVSGGRMFLTFDKDQLISSGVSANFGTNQIFDFDLIFHLENNNLVPILTNIALPPDSAYQDVIFQRIEPKPLNVSVDNDGNYLGWYRLKRGEKMDIKVVGSAKIYTTSKVKNPTLDENLRKKYTQSDKYWEKDNPVISAKLAEILGDNPEGSAEKVKLIYRFVVDNLKYDSSRLSSEIERLGAVTALNNPESAVCMEFTDLFIALARAGGIPARELDGYAYTVNPELRPLSLTEGAFGTKDILHSWPEYWDEERGWVMVDPTWENTTGGVDYFSKLDLNHFVFAIKGSSSEQPVPAGSYKFSGQDSQDVRISLAQSDFIGKPQIDVKISSSDSIWAGFPGKIKIEVENLGNALYPPSTLLVNSQKLIILGKSDQKLGSIPAFGTASFEYNIRTKSLFDSYQDSIEVLVGGQKFTKEVKIIPFFIFQTIPLISIAITAAIFATYLAILGVFIYRKRLLKKQKS